MSTTLLFPRSRTPMSDDSDKIRALIKSRQREDETWTEAVERFARSIYRDPSTVWRWLSNERRVPKSVRENLIESGSDET